MSQTGPRSHWQALSLLLNAPSKKAALKCFNRAFVNRHTVDQMPISNISEEFSLSEDQARELSMGVIHLVKVVLYDSDVEAAMKTLDSEVPTIDARLRGLIEQILSSQLPDWREASVLSRPSLPRFVSADWRVDVKTESDKVARMAVPSVLVDLELQDQPTSFAEMPKTRHVEFELSKEALQTMLEGLGRIRDQLGAVAGSK